MLRGKSSDPADCLVVEMLSRLPTEVIFEVTHWFQKRFQGESAELQRPGEFCTWCSSRILLSVFSKWYTTVYGGFTARGEGADRVDESARGSRERCEL